MKNLTVHQQSFELNKKMKQKIDINISKDLGNKN
jgi:hypothetical protein